MMTRRDLLMMGALGLTGCAAPVRRADEGTALFKISLAQWSLHRSFRSAALDPMDFARIARHDYDIAAIEYVNSFYKENYGTALLRELGRRAEGEGVKSLLIMCDGEGRLGDPDSDKRATAVNNHHKWIDAARALGCHSIRVNASSTGTPEEQAKLVADGLSKLAEYGARNDIHVIVENHGGLSSDGEWLAGVMRAVDHPYCGTLPDFGNFNYPGQPVYDRYAGVKAMMPFARAVSAKSIDFDLAGNETTIDYRRLLRIVRDAGYRGYLGIEYEGSRLPEPDGIRATKSLIERVVQEMAAPRRAFAYRADRTDARGSRRTLP